MRGSIFLGFLAFLGIVQAQLEMNFYSKSCPKAEKIIQDYVQNLVLKSPLVAAELLRLHFHDCFVRGCDASILLNSTSAVGNNTEKTASPNLTLGGFGFIEKIKSVVESECPGVVSCADIIALAARDSIVSIGGPSWKVPTGRRDGLISNAREALINIPLPTFNLSSLQTNFARKGLNLKDLIVLSGAHTIGVAHCSAFSNRLYNFTGVGDQDPALDDEYAWYIRTYKCKTISDNTTIVEMDPHSSKTFDRSYYSLLLKKKGLFTSDSALTTEKASKENIYKILKGSAINFYNEFAWSMEKMGKIDVKTGSAGEIRKRCAIVNS